jgi:hypothetical protein
MKNKEYRKKAEAICDLHDCELQETQSNIWLNAPDGKTFVSSGASTSLIYDLDQRDVSGQRIRPDWKILYATITKDISLGFEDLE